MTAFWIILAGSLVAVSCALLGTFLVLRKMAMVGDAISHSVLPGIVIAYLISDDRSGWVLLTGAALTGILASLLIEWFHRKARIQSDASIGITFTWLFAIGVILISKYAGDIDLDQECVLYGEIAYLPLTEIVTESGYSYGPSGIWILLLNLILVLLFVILGYRGLQITTFDPSFSAAIGISTAFWHYGLMSAVSLTTVFSFESVGAILVLAFLVVPAATAYLITEKLRTMLILASLFGVAASFGGYYLALWFDGSIAAAMALVSGGIFALVFLFAPQQGILFKYLRSEKLLSGKSLSAQEFPLNKHKF